MQFRRQVQVPPRLGDTINDEDLEQFITSEVPNEDAASYLGFLIDWKKLAITEQGTLRNVKNLTAVLNARIQKVADEYDNNYTFRASRTAPPSAENAAVPARVNDVLEHSKKKTQKQKLTLQQLQHPFEVSQKPPCSTRQTAK